MLVLIVNRRRNGRWPTLSGLLWLGALLAVGAWAERGIVWWAFGVPVVLAPALARFVAPGARESRPARARPEPVMLRRLNLGIVLALVALVVLLQPIWRPSPTLAGPDGLLTDAPVGLAAAMQATASPADRAVVPQRWAAWFEWAVPGVPVMVDSRIEVEPRSAWADYLAISAGGPGTLETLARIGATIVVVDRQEQGALFRALEVTGSGWRIVTEDGDGGVFRVAPTGARTSGA